MSVSSLTSVFFVASLGPHQGFLQITRRSQTHTGMRGAGPPPRFAALLLAAAALLFWRGTRAEADASSARCAVEAEGDDSSAQLSCAPGIIASVDWAHYGAPAGPGAGGVCNHTAVPTCDLDVSALVAAPCVGRPSCPLPPTLIDVTQDVVCPGVAVKRTVVKYTCGAAAPPAPPVGFQCAKLPSRPEPQPRPPYVSFASVSNFSRSAPFADPAAPETTPFDCAPPLCRSSAVSREECFRNAANFNVEADLDGAARTGCGADYRGWQLDYSDIVVGVSVHQSFLSRIDQQARP